MFGDPFYHQLIRKYVSIFGSLFNDIRIQRENGATVEQYFKVPISYAPREKYLAALRGKPGDKEQQILLPRMSFSISNINRAAERTFSKTRRHHDHGDDTSYFEPVPIDINFDLNIISKGTVDGLKIVEQIIPYFNPDLTVTAKLLDNSPRTWDLPITLDTITNEDLYEGDYNTKRAVLWTLTFVLQGWIHGPTPTKKVIKKITVNMIPTTNIGDVPAEQVITQPGLTANGEPTTDIELTVDYQTINKDDNWDYIVRIIPFEEEPEPDPDPDP